MLFAQAGMVAHWAIVLIVIVGIIGILFVVIREAGIQVPSFIITIGWILLACVLAVLAIRFLVGEMGP